MGQSKPKHPNHSGPSKGNSPPTAPPKVVASIPEPITVRHQETTEDNKRYTEQKENRSEQLKEAKRLNKITAAAAAIGIASLIGLIVNIMESRWSLQIDQRAYVVPEMKEFMAAPDPSGGLTFRAAYRNTGKTPAFRVISVCSVFGSTQAIPDQDTPRTTGKMMLSASGVAYCQVDSVKVTPEDIRKGSRLYFFGTVWFQDAFGKRHWTQFCYFPVYVSDNLVFNPCDNHNGTDDQPKG